MSAPAAALNLLAGMRLEDGGAWAERATSDQWADARAVLDPDEVPYHFLTRARGYSKTSDLAAISLAMMLAVLPAGSRLYGIASDRDQGRLLVDALAGFAVRTPGVNASVDVAAFKATAANGSTLEILAADAAGAWGLRPALLIIDELAQWTSSPQARQLWEATTTALAKVPEARLVVLTSAGDPAHWSHKVLTHAYADSLWRVHEVPGPPPWADPARLAEQRRRLSDSSYTRLFENRWAASEDRLVTPEQLADATVLDGPLPPMAGVHYSIGVDLGLRHDKTAIAVAHVEPIGAPSALEARRNRVVLDELVVLEGTKEREVDLGQVEERVFSLSRKFNRARTSADPWQLVGIMQRLRSRGVWVHEATFSSRSLAGMAQTLLTLLRDRLIHLPNDAGLLGELASVRLRESGSSGLLRIDHEAGGHDDRVTALALAVSAALDRSGWTKSASPSGTGRAVPYRFAAGEPGAAVPYGNGRPMFEPDPAWVTSGGSLFTDPSWGEDGPDGTWAGAGRR